MARIDPYRDEIAKLLAENVSQAEIIRTFKDRGVDIPRSSLSDFAKRFHNGRVATATQEAGEYMNDPAAHALLAQAEVMAAMQKAGMEEVFDRLGELIATIGTLEASGYERHAALLDAVGALRMAPQDSGKLDAAIGRMDALAARTAGAGLRWVWCKAFLWASGLWLLLGLGIALYLWVNPQVVYPWLGR